MEVSNEERYLLEAAAFDKGPTFERRSLEMNASDGAEVAIVCLSGAVGVRYWCRLLSSNALGVPTK